MNIETKYYNSIDQKHQIEIKIIDDISWFNINKLDNQFIKTFLILLKKVLEDLSSLNVKYIKQHLNINDLDSYTKSSFVEYDIENEIYTVSTKISDFIEEIISALGIKPI